jgi:hypothetical protein|uniref:Uncharacterized protein n=1 Tax=Zea mays TaxID=4577 RepID=B6SL58_MAIZE|nr:hypothetical protein [Zea mays]ACG25596.1 hypothetical protein [Zea mays]
MAIKDIVASFDLAVHGIGLLQQQLIKNPETPLVSYIYPQLIRGVKVRPPPAQEQGSGSSGGGKHRPLCPAGPGRAAAAGAPEDAVVDGVSGACKGRSPEGVRRVRQQGAGAMSQMAVSI